MPSPSAERDLGHQSNRLTRLLRAMLAREIAPLGLTPRQAAVVLQVGEAGTLTMSEIAERIDVDAPTLSAMVGRLERDGWLDVRANPADARSRLVSLPREAAAKVPDLAAASKRAGDAALSGFAAKDSADLLGLMKRASTNLERALAGEEGPR